LHDIIKKIKEEKRKNMKKIVEKLKQRGYETSYKKSGKEEELIIKKNDRSCSFHLIEHIIIQQLHYDTYSVLILEKDMDIMDDLLMCAHQKEKPLLILLKGGWVEENKSFFQCRGYEDLKSIEKIRYYDRSIQSGANIILKKDEYLIQENILLWGAFQKTIQKWKEKELLIDVKQHGPRKFLIYLNGLYVDVELNEIYGKLAIKMQDEQKNMLVQIIPSTPEEIKTLIDKWIKDKLKKQRLRSLTHPSAHFFNKWIEVIGAWSKKEQIYHAFCQYFQSNEIEQIAATCLKDNEKVKLIETYQRLIQFKEKYIFFSFLPIEVVIYERNSNLEEHLVQSLLKQEEIKIRKKIQDVLNN